MFRIEPSPLFWTAVRLTVPGEPAPAQVELQFAHKSVSDLREWVDRVRESNDRSTVAEVVRDWRGFDAEFSPDVLARMLQNYPAAGLEIFDQYVTALTESRAKN
ncbi:MAG: hypothetical protein KA154_06920 [Gemmatimonadaceae bacterium]|nr:hypothetical protein [Gemmatimonadaceae bacterium]